MFPHSSAPNLRDRRCPAGGAPAPFDDIWHWGETAGGAYADVAELLRTMRSFLRDNDMMACLAMMAVRLIELHRVLKPTGSLYLHCDPTASHYLKLLLDRVFGASNFRNEIIWLRHSARSVRQAIWPGLHDVILHYARDGVPTFTATVVSSGKASEPHDLVRWNDGKRYRTRDATGAGVRNGETGKAWRGVDVTAKGRHWRVRHDALDSFAAEERIHWQASGMPRVRDALPYVSSERTAVVGDVWTDVPAINAGAQERLGYPAQKPVALLERIFAASSNPGDVVLDPFCGCGTALDVAQRLGRRWIGIDVTRLAIT